MPRLLVLSDDRDAHNGVLAQRAADGAKSVRFTEVDVRTVAQTGTGAASHPVLESADAFSDYAGIIVVRVGSEVSGTFSDLLDRWDRSQRAEYVDTVVGVIGGGAMALLDRIARIGPIVVSEARGGDAETRARQTGVRVAKVVEWVRHALSHEHATGHRQHVHPSPEHPHAL